MALDKILRLQVVLPNVSAKPEDTYTNTFHFACDSANSALASAGEAIDRLKSFYIDGTPSVSTYINNLVPRSTTSTHIKAYDLDDPMPRTPLDVDYFQLDAAVAATRTASELCMCLSYHGAAVSGQSMARRRGRIYLGPLCNNSVDSTSGMLTASHLTVLRTAASTMKALNDGDLSWVVWSRAGNSSAVVTGGWTDDAPDVQRRREASYSSRITWT